MKASCHILVLAALLALAAGCGTLPSARYPWHGPLTDSTGQVVPRPDYGAPTNAPAHQH